MSVIRLLVLLAAAASHWALAQQPARPVPQSFESAKRIPEAELLPRLLPIEQLSRLGFSKPYRVEGVTTFESGSVLLASEIVFAPGSKLLLPSFSSGGPSSAGFGIDPGVYVVARRITVLPGQPAPVISWMGAEVQYKLPPTVGKAQPGATGFDGGPGGKGSDGAVGNTGVQGRAPPTLYLSFTEMTGGPLNIDWRGQEGGPGGPGQDGGDGGNGGTGRSASAGAFDCRRGPGDGGPGGAPGAGGPGGEGGRGGDGGTVVLVAASETIFRHSKRLVVDVSPGLGGFGGDGGKSGEPGAGGVAGKPAPPWCRADATRGQAWQGIVRSGKSLLEQRQAPGLPGQLYVGELAPSQAKALGLY